MIAIISYIWVDDDEGEKEEMVVKEKKIIMIPLLLNHNDDDDDNPSPLFLLLLHIIIIINSHRRWTFENSTDVDTYDCPLSHVSALIYLYPVILSLVPFNLHWTSMFLSIIQTWISFIWNKKKRMRYFLLLPPFYLAFVLLLHIESQCIAIFILFYSYKYFNLPLIVSWYPASKHVSVCLSSPAFPSVHIWKGWWKYSQILNFFITFVPYTYLRSIFNFLI